MDNSNIVNDAEKIVKDKIIEDSEFTKSFISSDMQTKIDEAVNQIEKAKDPELTEAEIFFNKKDSEITPEETKQFLFGKSPDEKVSIEDMNTLMTNMKNMIGTMETMWKNYQSMYKITDDVLKKLTEFNLAHRTEPAEEDLEAIRKGEKEFDSYNGLDHLTKEDVVSIFGSDNDIIVKDHSMTVKSIKQVIDTFFALVKSRQEFRGVYDHFMDLIEENELSKMAELKELAEKETDLKKQKKMLAAYDLFFNTKYLDFLREAVSPEQMNFVINSYTNANKIKYLIERGKEKLEKLGFSQMFVLEISKLEDRFLNEKYKKQSNILLAHFLNMVVYGDLKNGKSIDRSRVVAFVIALDRLARDCWSPELKERIVGNLEALEEQYLEPVAKALSELKKAKEEAQKKLEKE